jgi:hypothetical protein
MVAPVELVRELLSYRDMKIVSARDWGTITGLLAGASIAFPMLTPFAVGSLIAAGVQKVRTLRAHKAIEGVQLAPAVAPPSSSVISGLARKMRATIASVLDDDAVLAEHGEIRDGEAVVLRRSETAMFWLERDREPAVMVIGATRRIGHARPDSVPVGALLLARMGVPKEFQISGDLELSAIRDATHLTVIGELAEEAIAEVAFHREGGRVPVMRGRPGAPLLVSY